MRPRRYPYSFKPNLMNILDSRFYTRLIVETENGAKKKSLRQNSSQPQKS